MDGFDHVLLHIGSKSVLGPEERRQPGSRERGKTVGDMCEGAVDRGGVADDAEPFPVEYRRAEQPF
jgi:hypothetical protein